MSKWENTCAVLSIYYIFSAMLGGSKCNISKQIENIETENYETLIINEDNDLLMKAIRNFNYPLLFWNNLFESMESENCVKFPHPHFIPFENVYWQIYAVDDVTFRLYNAYLDTRELVDQPTVRILAMVNRLEIRLNLTCIFWYQNDTGVEFSLSDVSDYMLIWHHAWLDEKDETKNLPYLINCPVPKERISEVPVAVTLTEGEEKCKPASNAVKIIYHKVNDVKEQFAICVKGLEFPFQDISAQVVEWIELAKLLGVNKVFIYNFQVHPNTLRVLEYYELKGFIEITPLTYSLSRPPLLRTAKDFRHYEYDRIIEEVISYNDCWNKNMYKYEYISLLDIDEMIIPVNVDTWVELIDQIENNNRTDGSRETEYISYAFRETRFSREMANLSDVPVSMTMTRRILRKEFSQRGLQTKSIHNTDYIITLHNHYFIKSFGDNMETYDIDSSIAQLSHYRNCNSGDPDGNCFTLDSNNGTIDTLLWKYYEYLKPAVENVFHELENFK